MKKFFTLFASLIFVCILSTPVWGQLFIEDFDYTIGTNLTASGWLRYYGFDAPIKVTSPGLTYPGYINSGIGNATLLIGGAGDREDVMRTFTVQSSGSVYAFFMVNVHADTTVGKYFFHLGPDPIGTIRLGKVHVKDSAGFVAFGLSKGSSWYDVEYIEHKYLKNTTYLLALKYKFNTENSTDDEVSLWVNPPLSGIETIPDLTQTDDVFEDAPNIGTVCLQQRPINHNVSVDGIRIQTTWLQPKFNVSPGSLDFGNLFVGSTYHDTVTVINTGDVTLDISSVISDNPDFIVIPTSGSIAISDSQDFYIIFGPTSAGPKTGNIIFSHNAPSLNDTVNVSGTGIAPIFAVTPKSIDYGNLFIGSTYKDTVTVTNTGNATLDITSVISDNAEFSVSPTSGSLAVSASKEFYITFSPTSTGLKMGNIVFSHNAPSINDTVTVKGTGIVSAFSASPTNINFGDIYLNLPKTDTVTVTNNGSAVLIIFSVVTTNGEFGVSPTSGSIPVNGSQKFAITFSPSSVGMKYGKFIFNHNAPSSPDTVTASGNGIEYITISDARIKPNGETVVIQGIITRTRGAFSRIQDATGGLSIRQTSGAFFDSLATGGIRSGDLVKMTGVLSEYANLKQFNQADILSFTRIARDNPLATPQAVTLSDLVSNGEQYESELITITNLSINPAGDVNFSAAKTYQITDPTDITNAITLRTPNASDSDIDGEQIPTGLFTFTGVLGQFSFSDPTAGYQLLPVLKTDIDFTVDARENEPLPTVFALKGNYPNPFNPTTKIAFDIPKSTNVSLVIYNAIGQKVDHILDNKQYQPGRYEVTFDASHLTTGIYFYRFVTPEYSAVQKMILIK